MEETKIIIENTIYDCKIVEDERSEEYGDEYVLIELSEEGKEEGIDFFLTTDWKVEIVKNNTESILGEIVDGDGTLLIIERE